MSLQSTCLRATASRCAQSLPESARSRLRSKAAGVVDPVNERYQLPEPVGQLATIILVHCLQRPVLRSLPNRRFSFVGRACFSFDAHGLVEHVTRRQAVEFDAHSPPGFPLREALVSAQRNEFVAFHCRQGWFNVLRRLILDPRERLTLLMQLGPISGPACPNSRTLRRATSPVLGWHGGPPAPWPHVGAGDQDRVRVA